MNVETLRTLVINAVSGGAAFFLMGKYRGMIDAFLRRGSKTLTEAFIDGLNEQEKNEYAKLNMFGSQRATLFGRLIVFGITFLLLIAMVKYRFLAALIGAYLLLGMVITARVGIAANDIYPRLSLTDKLVFRTLYGAFWPWYIHGIKE
jgi:hypothetical protein